MIEQEPMDAAQADMANAEQWSRRDVAWKCPYCTKRLDDEMQMCCGELHAEPMTEADDENE